MASFRLPVSNAMNSTSYLGIDQDGSPVNFYCTYVRTNGCMLDFSDDEPLVLYSDVNDTDCEFIIGVQSGRLTDAIAKQYGFDSAQAAYDDYEDVSSPEDAARFFANCDACGEAIASPNATDILKAFIAGDTKVQR